MSGLNPGLIKTFVAGGAIPAFSLVKFGADDRTVVVAAAATDQPIGVSTSLPAASGERVDIIHSGIGEVLLAGTVTRGVSYIVANAAGAGVASAAAAGTNNGAVGLPLQSGVSGDVIPVLIVPQRVQG